MSSRWWWRGSADATICASTYLPPGMTAEEARAYCLRSHGVVLRLGGKPVGIAVASPDVSPGEGVDVPAGAVEFDMWILGPYRGQGSRWVHMVVAWMAERYDYLVGVTWAHNAVVIALLEWAGFEHLGRSFWRGDGCAGPCEVFLHDLKALRARAAR